MYFKVEHPKMRSQSLNGWFDGFCPSKGIAENLNRKAKGVWAEQEETQKKLEALKNGAQAGEWENLKKETRRLDDVLSNLKRDLEKELAIASAIGVDMTGLGAWCNGAVSDRKKAEASLREAEKALGEVKGAIDTLSQQQTLGIKEAGSVIKANQQHIETVKAKIRAVQVKIEAFKAKRDHDTKSLATGDGKSEAKSDLIGTLKENAPLILAGAVITGVVIYKVSKKSKPKKTPKTVVA